MFLSIIKFVVVKLHDFVHNEKIAKPAFEVLGLALAVLLGILIHRHFAQPTVTIVQTTPDTKTITVQAPTLTPTTIEKFINDPKDKATIAALLKQNGDLKLSVVQLTNTVATLQSHGGTGTDTGGIITPVLPLPDVAAVPSYQFKDWRLFATYSANSFTYDLNQKFSVFTTTGTDKNGKRTEFVQLFEQGPNGERIAVPATTTAIIADPTAPHWFVHLNVQGGISVVPGNVGGIIGMQWVHKGTTTAPGDQTWSILTPVVVFSTPTPDVGILPVSVNVGHLHHQPFTNVWLSPYVGVSRFGLAVSATF
jgi:hypothetical protein